MKLDITSRHYDASDRLKSYISREMDKLEKYFDRIVDAKVTLEGIESDHVKISVILNVPGKSLVADVSDTDVTRAVDDVVNKIVRQLKKYKEGLKAH